MPQFQIAVLVGSLRRDSFNRKLADAMTRLAPPDFTLKQLNIDDLPLYNQDDDAHQAQAVLGLKSEIKAAPFHSERWSRSLAPGPLTCQR